MNFKTQLTALLLCLSFAPIFAQNYYIYDNAPFTLPFSKQGEIKLSALPPYVSDLNFHLGYSPIKHLYLSGGLLHSNFEFKNEFFTIKTLGKVYTASIGTYYSFKSPSFKKSKPTNNLKATLLELQVGFSQGNVSNEIDPDFSADLDFQSTFVKFGISHQFKFIRFGTYYKYNRISYKGGEVLGGNVYPEIFEEALKIDQENGYHTHEILTQLTFGLPQLQLFIGGSTLINPSEAPNFSNKRAAFVGLIFEIDDIVNWIKK